MLSSFADLSGGTAVAGHLAAASLTAAQRQQVLAAIGAAVTDTFYTLLLSLDGSASLGGTQRTFIVTDESGNVVANGDGRLEASAWDAFHAS
jgi:hypothetical protein